MRIKIIISFFILIVEYLSVRFFWLIYAFNLSSFLLIFIFEHIRKITKCVVRLPSSSPFGIIQ